VNSIVPEPLKGFEQILIEMFHTDGRQINQVYKVMDSKVKVMHFNGGGIPVDCSPSKTM